MKKQLFACMLAIVLLFGAVPPGYAAEDAEQCSDNMLFMKDLGVIYGYEDGTLRPDNNITRMEFVTMVLRLLGYYHPEEFSGGESMFSDVPDDLWGAAGINFSHRLGFIDGHGDGTFGPEESVTVNQAVKVLVCTLGYKPMAEKMGYPAGYLTHAAQLGVLNGVATGEIAATRAAVADLMANALEAEIVETVYNADQTVDYTKSGKTLLDAMGIEKQGGFVYAVPGISIDADVDLEANQVLVDTTVYDVKCGNVSDSIASEVTIWVNTDSALRRPQILHMEKTDSRSDITVAARDVSAKTTPGTLVYYDNAGKEKSVTLPDGAAIIYNGKLLSTAEMTADRLMPESGYVTVKNTGGTGPKTVLIWDFKNYVVQTVTRDGTVYDIFGEKLDLEDSRLSVEVTVDGIAAELSALKADDILNVAASLDGMYYKILASRKTVSGTITRINDASQPIYDVTADDGKHALYLAKSYQKRLDENSSKLGQLYPGDSALFLLDAFDEIVYTKEADRKSEVQYGYIADAVVNAESFGDKELNLRILNENNRIEDYTLSESDSLRCGATENGVYTTRTHAFDSLLNEIVAADGVKRQAIKYKKDSQGQLRELYLSASGQNSEMWGDCVDTTYSYAYYNGTIDGRFLIDANTIGFYIPSAGDEIELFKSGRAVTMMSSAAYDVQLYDIVDNHVGVVVIKTHIPTNYGYQYMLDMANGSVMLIESMDSYLDGDETVSYVTGWQDGERVSVPVADILEENSDRRELLHEGMLIQYLINTEERSRAKTADEREEIILFRVIEDFNRDVLTHYQTWNYKSNENSNAKIRVISGSVAAYDLPNLLIDCGQDAAASVDDGVNVIRWNNKTKKAEKATIQDIMRNENILVRTRYNVTKDIYIFQ